MDEKYGKILNKLEGLGYLSFFIALELSTSLFQKHRLGQRVVMEWTVKGDFFQEMNDKILFCPERFVFLRDGISQE
ncbi:hypothetical protein [Bartonella tribocorum]|uniref:hypothetical protein n=1 Tax=Bartonella tribocorum TaxID=85701 RepID=UPI001177E050|nr:hypothetical protein [Bartonella tribocorum]